MNNYIEKEISAADGLRLYTRDYRGGDPAKRPILCLSGLTRNSKDFENIADHLHSLGHRVVTFDYRGRGKSEYDANWENYNPTVYVSDIFNVASALGLHNCHLIGTSLGGLLSMAMCVVSPGLVHSVILNDVGPDLDETGVEKIIAYTGDGESVADLEGAVQKLKKHYKDEHGFVDADWHRIAKKTYRLEKGRYVPSWDVKIADSLRHSAANDQKQDLWPYFYALAERPVLLIRGQASSVFNRETYLRMLESLPHITGIEVKDVGHAPTLDEEDVRQAVLNFISA